MKLHKTLIIASVVAAMTAVSGTAWADKGGRHHDRYDRHGRYDHARVVDVDPITKSISHRIPRESCWDEQVRYEEPGYRSHTGAILGGIIGAAIGNELGHHKSNKQVGAIAGGVLGASIGNDISRRHGEPGRVGYRTERRCETHYDVEYEERIVGYDVTYRYRGETYHTRTDHHPGRKIRVRVKVTPAY